eukprot:maker-scaffold331_size203155-snap-gene-0.2 protein:Tk00662 transcript:maker-scaffold331_size203155-snap-gene-0.2-mRNA-1 annotation:"fad-binding protein"
MKKIGLYLFTNDLRINDNQLLHYAAQSVDKLVCVIVEPTLVHFSADLAQEQSYGAHRQAFISQSIANLESNLVKLGQQLVVIHSNHIEPGSAEKTLSQIIATQHVTHFFANAHCSYDERQLIRSTQRQSPNLTRNAFDGIENSTKFSPWLALGCVSPKTIYRHLKQFEADHGSNDSTYWIYFELLWREYFYWTCLSLGSSLFGDSSNRQLYSPNSSATSNLNFAKWKSGNTNYPIVDACMRQLNETGYMSNRGRQLTASCLIYELGIDWRHGAAYFESQLIDHDVASNWGNWAYIAGALNKPAHNEQTKNQSQPKSRHFDLAKQTEMYDPDHSFINQW